MKKNSSEKPVNSHNGTMSLIDHLGELRIRIIRFLMVMGVFVICCYFFRREILDLIKKPVEAPLQKYATVSIAVEKDRVETAVLPHLYQCSCENIAADIVAEAAQDSLQAAVDKAAVTKKNRHENGGENGKTGISPWLEKAKGAFFDFAAYFQVMLGMEPTASSQYIKRESGSRMPASSVKTLRLNCQCQIESTGDRSQKELHSSMIYIGLPELFFAQMKAAVFAGFFLAFPYLLIEIWGFVGPALYRTEKKIFWIFAITSYICFVGGSLFGYLIVFPFGFDFFLSLTQPGEIMPSLSIGEYLSLSIKLLLAFGFIFEMPLAIFILARLGIVTPELMFRQARIAVLIIFVLSAFLTPPDPFTMILMAGPLITLYIVSIIVCFLGVNRKKVALRKQGFANEGW